MARHIDFSSVDEYREYAKTLSLHDLHDILRNIDREKHPERYEIIAGIAAEKGSTVPGHIAYPKGVILIRNIFIALFILLAISLTINLLLGSIQPDLRNILMAMLSILIIASIIAGIHYVKPWVVTLILWFSYLSLARLFLETMGGTATPRPGHPISTLLFAIFCASQIVIFSKATTKSYFRHSGTDII